MRKITKNNLCENRPYINLKKLPLKTNLRVGNKDQEGLKTTYLINQETQSLSKNQNYTTEYEKGIEKNTYPTEELNHNLLIEINHTERTSKMKIYALIENIKYALPFTYFEDIYIGCMEILKKELQGTEEIKCIEECFKALEKEETIQDMELNLKRLKEFKDKVNYKRNVDYFVINNILSSISKFDITNLKNTIEPSERIKVLRYGYQDRLYDFVKAEGKIVTLRETDLICDLGDKGDFPTVHIYTNYGLGKLLDVKNNVIPTQSTLQLFANLLDLGLNVLN